MQIQTTRRLSRRHPSAPDQVVRLGMIYRLASEVELWVELLSELICLHIFDHWHSHSSRGSYPLRGAFGNPLMPLLNAASVDVTSLLADPMGSWPSDLCDIYLACMRRTQSASPNSYVDIYHEKLAIKSMPKQNSGDIHKERLAREIDILHLAGDSCRQPPLQPRGD
jgi:hypothetical protein